MVHIDASVDDSSCTALQDAVVGELWGALYASGHLEITHGSLKLQPVIEIFRLALRDAGYDVEVNNIQGQHPMTALCARGFRATINTKTPFYSLHMDAELAMRFGNSKDQFDRVTKSVLESLADVCSAESVGLGNPIDLDFSYTNGTASYTVLRSAAADAIADPLIVAIRDWHRSRGARSVITAA